MPVLSPCACCCRPGDIEREIAAFLVHESDESNHFRFVFETRGEQNSVRPVLAVSKHTFT